MPARISGKKARARMREIGLSPARLGSASGLSPSTIDRILNDRASTYNDDTVRRVADALQCSPFDLYDDTTVTAALAEAAPRAVENAIVEAVAEAVTVVAEELAPETPVQSVAESVPAIPVSLPPALDVAAYFAYIQEQHKNEVEQLTALHRDAITSARREAGVWRTVALVLLGLLCIVSAVILFTHA
jgi:transcriptional regulator with XRE-family HTH domain